MLALACATPSLAADPGDVLEPLPATAASLGDALSAPVAAPAEPVTNGFDGAAPAAPLVGSAAELGALRTAAAARAARLEGDTARLEAAVEASETKLDDALGRYTDYIVQLFDVGETDRIQALIAVRNEQDFALRPGLLAALAPTDRTVAETYLTAVDASLVAAAALDAARIDLEQADARVEAIDIALAEQRPAAADADAARPGHSIDADYIFATGPIPGIGYWGAASGGGFLDGWSNMATAAVGGVGCTPPDATLRATGQVEAGDASWYGPGFHGKNTASGEVYDQEAMTAAHRTLPFGTVVRVYSTSTARCAFLRINDRGP
ncbi:MAG: rlpA, partial [Thermoleophilia bacterium]|nr:rlpA [Thermoleophilia bacterium]